jgi:3-methyladenine DNA glycosylase AlkD
MMANPGPDEAAGALADEIDRQIRSLPDPTTTSIRRVRRDHSRRLRQAPPAEVLAVAEALVDRQRWVAYELVYHHGDALSALAAADVERLGRGIGDWGSVDAFGRYISGPAWQRGRVGDHVILRWAASPDRWWRRAALVSTVPLNLRSAGGTGDTRRTLEVCALLASDRDDMIVKALSWALRELVIWDPDAVRRFVDVHRNVLAARVRREVKTKLETGRKNPARS